MKCKARGNGSAGGLPYKDGDALEGDSEFIRRMLVNHVFLPLDAQAQEFYDNPGKYSEHSSEPLMAVAAELDAKGV